jgi:outer membrane protein assembly factor BamB
MEFIMFTFFSSGFSKFWALLTAILLTITINAESPPGVPDGAVLVTSHTYMLDQALTRGQGVTTDGQYFYFSGNLFLNKTDMQTNKTLVKNVMAIPPQLLLLGDNHIGGISYYDGKIYAPIEDGSAYQHPYIAIFDAATLKFTGKYYAMPLELHDAGIPWCIVDGPRGYLYTMEWSNATVLNVFNLNDMSLVKTVPLSMPLDRIQGGGIYDGNLYLSMDVGSKSVYKLNPVTGAASLLFKCNLSPDVEAESMTVLSTDKGPLFCVMGIGPKRINMVLREYKLAD